MRTTNKSHRKQLHVICNDINTFKGDRVKVMENIDHYFFSRGEIFVVTDTKRDEHNNLLLCGGFFGKWILAEKCFIVKPKIK